MGGFDAASLRLLTGAVTFFLDERAVNSRAAGIASTRERNSRVARRPSSL